MRFEELRAAATAAAAHGDYERALAALDQAAALWQLPLLQNVESPLLHRHIVPRLVERYLSLQEERVETTLRLGRRVAIEDLLSLTQANPFRERLMENLMLALSLDGRKAEALHHYDRLRKELRAQLGIDPGPAIQDLYLRMLRGGVDRDFLRSRASASAAAER